MFFLAASTYSNLVRESGPPTAKMADKGIRQPSRPPLNQGSLVASPSYSGRPQRWEMHNPSYCGMYVCMYVCMYACMYVCMYVCFVNVCMICNCMYVCMYVCVYVCINIYSCICLCKRCTFLISKKTCAGDVFEKNRAAAKRSRATAITLNPKRFLVRVVLGWAACESAARRPRPPGP